MAKIIVKIQKEKIITDEINKKLCKNNLDIGALVCFTGICRSENGKIEFLELEHYSKMAQKQLNEIAIKASKRWKLYAMAIIHRFGKIKPGENIVMVSATAKHRQQAFEATQFAMDFLKTNAPFWKKEKTARGTKWIGEKTKDLNAQKKWHSTK